MIHKVISAFSICDYPFWPFHYQSPELSLYIRMPPDIPPEIETTTQSLDEAMTACPAISNITIHHRLRGQGLFAELQTALLALTPVKALCITTVANERLRLHLSRNPNWQPLHHIHRVDPIPGNCRDFYRLSPEMRLTTS